MERTSSILTKEKKKKRNNFLRSIRIFVDYLNSNYRAPKRRKKKKKLPFKITYYPLHRILITYSPFLVPSAKTIFKFSAPHCHAHARLRRNTNAAKTAKWNLLRSRQATALPVLCAHVPTYIYTRLLQPHATHKPTTPRSLPMIYTVSVVTLTGP